VVSLKIPALNTSLNPHQHARTLHQLKYEMKLEIEKAPSATLCIGVCGGRRELNMKSAEHSPLRYAIEMRQNNDIEAQ